MEWVKDAMDVACHTERTGSTSLFFLFFFLCVLFFLEIILILLLFSDFCWFPSSYLFCLCFKVNGFIHFIHGWLQHWKNNVSSVTWCISYVPPSLPLPPSLPPSLSRIQSLQCAKIITRNDNDDNQRLYKTRPPPTPTPPPANDETKPNQFGHWNQDEHRKNRKKSINILRSSSSSSRKFVPFL